VAAARLRTPFALAHAQLRSELFPKGRYRASNASACGPETPRVIEYAAPRFHIDSRGEHGRGARVLKEQFISGPQPLAIGEAVGCHAVHDHAGILGAKLWRVSATINATDKGQFLPDNWVASACIGLRGAADVSPSRCVAFSATCRILVRRRAHLPSSVGVVNTT
jgi:hypothetical protein